MTRYENFVPFNIVVSGGRKFNDYELLKRKLDEFREEKLIDSQNVNIIAGKVSGADLLAKRYAEENRLSFFDYDVKWEEEGEDAWKNTNLRMLKIGEAVFCFWDGNSVGTKHMIDEAANFPVHLETVIYGPESEKTVPDIIRDFAKELTELVHKHDCLPEDGHRMIVNDTKGNLIGSARWSAKDNQFWAHLE